MNLAVFFFLLIIIASKKSLNLLTGYFFKIAFGLVKFSSTGSPHVSMYYKSKVFQMLGLSINLWYTATTNSLVYTWQ